MEDSTRMRYLQIQTTLHNPAAGITEIVTLLRIARKRWHKSDWLPGATVRGHVHSWNMLRTPILERGFPISIRLMNF